MRFVDYRLVDVFTDRPFGGNPLAVVMDGNGLSDALMQSIARELNLSETTFILPPKHPQHDFHVRIFTPASELPMAGHPTIGTAFVLARQGLIAKPRIVFEEGVGPIPVSVDAREGTPVFSEMCQPLPSFGPALEDIDAVAAMLSIVPAAIRDTALPVEIVSCGVPFLFVPLVDLRTIKAVRLRLDLWEQIVRHLPAKDVFVFTKEVEFEGSSLHSRMFAPAHGIAEDPATGGASGPLGCYVVRHKVIPSTDELRCTSEQGIEIGRPSFIKIRIEHDEDNISNVRVGGTCRYMGAGYFELDESVSSAGQ